MNLKEIVSERLKQLGIGPVEAATAGGIERTYIRDIIEGKKKSVRADKLAGLAKALKLDASALAEGRMVPTDEGSPSAPLKEEFDDLFSRASEEDQEAVLQLMRRLVASRKG
ncbi:hypothetical protein [Brucella sp. IR073]|uniref:hypothetical protein n=1 Tax=unclassified Brucella TaxID=2632610 RepID=UPI003B985F65